MRSILTGVGFLLEEALLNEAYLQRFGKQMLTYHPHAHLLVPAGGVHQHAQWVAARQDYLVPVEALALIFRGMFLQMVRRALPRQHLPNSLWTGTPSPLDSPTHHQRNPG